MSNATEKDPARERFTKYGEKLLEPIFVAVPLGVISAVMLWITKSITAQPWHILLFLAPMSVVTWMLWRWVTRRGSLQLRGPMLLFLIGYLSIFSLAGAARLLDWKYDSVAVSETQLPRQRVAPARWGDWRYLVARRDAPSRELVVISMPQLPNADDGRFQVARLLRMAAIGGVKGIALDFYFGGETSAIDSLLCDAAREAGVPVIAGVQLALGEVTGALFSRPYPDTLEQCWPRESRGHLHAIRDADGRVRHIVLRIPTADSISLSTHVARVMTGKPSLVADTLIRFLESKPAIKPIEWDRLANVGSAELGGMLRGRFLLAGEDSPREIFHTPLGDRLGVQIHAAAIMNMVSGRWIRQTPWWAGTLIILVSCYLLTVFAAEGASRRRQFQVVAAVTGAVVLLAILVMYFWTVWLDVAYPLVAVWLLFVMLLSFSRRLNRSVTSEPVTDKDAA